MVSLRNWVAAPCDLCPAGVMVHAHSPLQLVLVCSCFLPQKKGRGCVYHYSLGQLAFLHVLRAFARTTAYSVSEGNLLQLRRCCTVLYFLQLVVIDSGVFNNNNSSIRACWI